MSPSDFAEPLTLPSMMDSGPSTSDSVMGATPLDPNSPPEESVAILTSMGFPRAHSINALKAMVSPAAATLASLCPVRVCPSSNFPLTVGKGQRTEHGSSSLRPDVGKERGGDDGGQTGVSQLGRPTC